MNIEVIDMLKINIIPSYILMCLLMTPISLGEQEKTIVNCKKDYRICLLKEDKEMCLQTLRACYQETE